jgi:hypothetical protein
LSWTDLKKNIGALVLEGWTSYVIIAIALLLLLLIVGLTTQYVVRDKAEKLTQTHVLPEDGSVQCTVVGSAEKEAYINLQRKTISAFGNSHRKGAISFFTYFYITYVVFSVFGLLAAISLAIITKTGINNASPHLITVFLVSTAIVILYQGAFGVFQHKQNIDSNARLAINYAVLIDQIDTYCVTGKLNVKDPNEALNYALPKVAPTGSNSNAADRALSNVNKATRPDPTMSEQKIQPFFVSPTADEFINFIAWQMEHLRSFSIAVDDTKVSSIDNKRFMLQ